MTDLLSLRVIAQFFQEDLEKQQQQVNSLTHMVVVVDDGSNESATADLEEQLAVLGERWSNVCKWAEQRLEILMTAATLESKVLDTQILSLVASCRDILMIFLPRGKSVKIRVLQTGSRQSEGLSEDLPETQKSTLILNEASTEI